MVLTSRPGSTRVSCRPNRRWRVWVPFPYNVAGPDGMWEAEGGNMRGYITWRAGDRWQHRPWRSAVMDPGGRASVAAAVMESGCRTSALPIYE